MALIKGILQLILGDNMETQTGKWLGLTVAFFALLCLSTQGHASEIRIGIGKSHAKLVGDGVWQQTGLDNTIENGKVALMASYVGNTRIRWLDYGLGIHYLKGPKASGEFVSDGCYAVPQFSGDLNGTAGYCDTRYFVASAQGETFGIKATLDPTWRLNKATAISLSLGGLLFNTSEKIDWDQTRGVCAEVACETSTFKENGITPYAELTFTYYNAYISAFFVKDVGGPNAVSGGATGFLLGYRHEL